MPCEYGNVVRDVLTDLTRAVARAEDYGIARRRLIIDPASALRSVETRACRYSPTWIDLPN
jgi:dihydropteroate synthase